MRGVGGICGWCLKCGWLWVSDAWMWRLDVCVGCWIYHGVYSLCVSMTAALLNCSVFCMPFHGGSPCLYLNRTRTGTLKAISGTERRQSALLCVVLFLCLTLSHWLANSINQSLVCFEIWEECSVFSGFVIHFKMKKCTVLITHNMGSSCLVHCVPTCIGLRIDHTSTPPENGEGENSFLFMSFLRFLIKTKNQNSKI